METLLRNAVRLRTYDSYDDAIGRGIIVGILPIETAPLIWVPQDNAVILTSLVTDANNRHDLLAYGLAWSDVEDTRLMRRYRAGRTNSDAIVRRVRRIASRRLILPDSLALTLPKSTSATDICQVLDVSPFVLADRLRDMTARETRLFGKYARALRWPPVMQTNIPIAVGLGAPVMNLAEAAMNAGLNAADTATDVAEQRIPRWTRFAVSVRSLIRM